jgi:hypothetical protein
MPTENDPRALKGWEAMIRAFFDRNEETLAGVRWALFQPGMYEELLLATDQQLLEALEWDDVPAGVKWLQSAFGPPVGSWIPFKDGIAIRLGPMLVERFVEQHG